MNTALGLYGCSVCQCFRYISCKILTYLNDFSSEAADDVVSADGKIEMVMAAAQGISASTAQLVVASRVKAERGSNSLQELTGASRNVTQATAGVLTSAKACVQLVEQSGEFRVATCFLDGIANYTTYK